MSESAKTCTLFLCGDVMTGRGIDQVLQHPSLPELYEPMVRSARDYVTFAEREHGPIAKPVDDSYVWGVALGELERRKPDARIINLETSITTSALAEPKGINYRMHPANVGVLSAARIDCAVLANNHVLDWGVPGLHETLDTLATAGIRTAGAGRTRAQAETPATLDLNGQARVLVFALGASDSGIPPRWAASEATAGVNWVGDFGARAVARASDLVASSKRAGDIVVLSVHWGSNWGYRIPDAHRRFAHQLIEQAGVDLVYGHSSHHVKAIEVHRGRAIFYGCGDFLNDYEGIRGGEDFRDDLTMMYFPTLDTRSGELAELAMVPLLIRNFRLQNPDSLDARWLCQTVDRECRRFGASVTEHDGRVTLAWG